jgi:transposase
MRRSFGQEISGNRRLKAELTPAARAALLAKHKAGVSRAELTHEFDVHLSCMYKTIKRWSNHKTLKSLPRSGRPEKLTRREKRVAIQAARRAPKIKYKPLIIEAGVEHVSRATIYQLLKEKGLMNYRYKKRPKFSAGHAALRLKFSREYRHFNWECCTVKFSNKCSVERGSGQNVKWYFCYPGEKWNKEII